MRVQLVYSMSGSGYVSSRMMERDIVLGSSSVGFLLLTQ